MKSQMTVFMILGLIVLILVGTLFVTIDKFKFQPDNPLEEKTRINTLVSSCIDQVGGSGARIISAQGGYIEPVLSEDVKGIRIAYGYYNQDITLATISEIETQLAEYIDLYVPECIKAGLPRASVDKAKTEVTVLPEEILVETSCRVELDSEIEDIFKTEITLPLGRMHTLAEQAIQHIEPDWVDLSSLALLPVHINIASHDESIIYYMLDNTGLMFNFAAQYIKNQPPALYLPDTLNAHDGETWTYQVVCTDPENDKVTISDSTVMIDTLPNGSINSTMEVPGNYPITFKCEDTHNNIDEKTITMIVK